MINSKSKTLAKLSHLSSSDHPILDHRRSSASTLKQRKHPLHNHSNSSTTFNLTRDIPLLPHDSLTQRINTNHSGIHDNKHTDRSIIKSSKIGITTTIANFQGIISSQDNNKQPVRRAKTQVLTLARPSSSMPASFRKLNTRLSVGEIENIESQESKDEVEIREKILKDIPRMKTMSSIMMNTARDMKAKFRKIDTMTKLDFSQTFRSKFEEDIVADAISKVEEYAGNANKGEKTRVVKLNCAERFIVEQDKKVIFKMKTENVRFPLDVRIDFFTKDCELFF